ncbi:hypothetical protein GCM10027341_38800 [Spirosoma knui]
MQFVSNTFSLCSSRLVCQWVNDALNHRVVGGRNQASPTYHTYRLLAGLLLLLSLATGSLRAQQFMLPPPLRQITQPSGMNLMVDYIAHGPGQEVWLPTDNGLVLFDAGKFQPIRVLHAAWQPQDDAYAQPAFTADGRIWLRQHRVGNPRGHLTYVDPARKKIHRVADTTRLVREFLARYDFGAILAGRQDQLWIALRNRGLLRVNTRTLATEHVLIDSLNILDLTEAADGRIWFTTSAALHWFDPRTRQRGQYVPALTDKNRITGAVRVRANGDILIGLLNEIRLLTPRTGNVRQIHLPKPDTESALWTEMFEPDGQGNEYFSVGRMVFRLTAGGELQRIEFPRPAEKVISLSVRKRTGTAPILWVNTITRSLSAYDLSRVRPIPPFNILDIKVNGTRLAENEHHTDDRFRRDSTGQASLTLQEADFVQLRFAPNAELSVSSFRYKLEGYDQQWTAYRDVMGQASYQLPAGQYVFLFAQARPGGGWSEQTARLLLSVEPPFWRRGWFMVVVALVLGSGIWGLFRILARRQKLQRELTRREDEAANLRQLDELKGRFFANVTHELRTPLTLLLNANAQLLRQPLDDQGHKHVSAIERNADQLLRLINQLLDMARLDGGKLALKPSLGDPVAFVSQLVESFGELAETKQIKLLVEAAETGGSYLFDHDKLEAIGHNLLSNALKFTPMGGTVRVDVHITPAHVLVLTITDTGPGISSVALPHIFERFYQVDSSSTRAYGGTGIGLALVKELVTLQQGTVAVNSQPGMGSTFIVRLPYHPANDSALFSEVQPNSRVLPSVEAEDLPDEKPVVLLVEDNAELGDFIADSLPPTYQIHRAMNGQQGFEQALRLLPDLVISDVLMPVLDGYGLCQLLKADIRTNHVPIILLTAKASIDSRLEGLSAGADDYLTKPFHVRELQLRVGNLLEQRRRLRERVQASLTSLDTRPPDALETVPDPFLGQLYTLIEAHLDQSDFGIEQLAQALGISRSYLFRKVKALTSMSVSELERNYRLKRATYYLQQGYGVAETGYMVGFETPAYFTQSFRKLYGLTPTDYLAQHSKPD